MNSSKQPDSSIRPQAISESDADGKLLDRSCQTHSFSGSLKNFPFLQPDNGRPVLESLIFINGILTDVKLHFQDMQALANTGAEVLGLHNGTFGLMRDLRECIDDLKNRGENPAVRAAQQLIQSAISSCDPLHLIGHSQGAIIISRALSNAIINLKAQGVTISALEEGLSHINIETYGGGAAFYPDGPNYVHVDNWLDPVPFNLGVGFGSRLLSPKSNPGRGAVQYTFFRMNSPLKRLPGLSAADKKLQLARYIDYIVHGPQDIYFPVRNSFAEMRSGNFRKLKKGFTLVHP